MFAAADAKTGAVALCSCETFSSERSVKGTNEEDIDEGKEITKFLVKVQPKVICLPDITEASDLQLITSALVRCPGPHIVSGSTMQLLTLHTDGLLRLWNTDDGRCVLASHHTMLQSKPVGMCVMNDYPGYVAVVGAGSEI